MAYIFKLLTPLDRVKIERVCRRWNYIARNFAWNNMTKLNMESIAPSPTSNFHTRPFLYGEQRVKAMTCRVLF